MPAIDLPEATVYITLDVFQVVVGIEVTQHFAMLKLRDKQACEY